MNATTCAPATNGYWETATTNDPFICPFCGQTTDWVGYFDKGNHNCVACGGKSTKARFVRGSNRKLYTFTRFAPLERPWSTINCLQGATLLGAPDIIVSRMKVPPDQRVCPCCGDQLVPVVWEVTEYGYTGQRAYMYCDDCGIYCRAWLV